MKDMVQTNNRFLHLKVISVLIAEIWRTRWRVVWKAKASVPTLCNSEKFLGSVSMWENSKVKNPTWPLLGLPEAWWQKPRRTSCNTGGGTFHHRMSEGHRLVDRIFVTFWHRSLGMIGQWISGALRCSYSEIKMAFSKNGIVAKRYNWHCAQFCQLSRWKLQFPITHHATITVAWIRRYIFLSEKTHQKSHNILQTNFKATIQFTI